MKQIKHIFIILSFAGILSSCESWLAQVPFDKVPGNQLYATELGAQEALNGLYLGMVDRNIYGGELTFGAIEALVQHYYTPDDHRYVKLSAYDFTSNEAKEYFSAIWSKLYGLIAACNVFLEQIELNKANYSAAHFKLYKGEAIALRAYLHFDLFRLFAPAYTEANKTKEAIPYYNKEVNAPEDYMSVEEIVVQLLADVNEAIELLAGDPILNGDELSRGETFWDYRNFRLNIYAAHALKARICLYTGNKPDAYSIASSLLNGTLPGGGSANFMNVFPSMLSVHTTYPTLYRENVGFTEVIFGMHDVSRVDVQRNYFSTDLATESILLAGNARYITLFTDNADIRTRSFVETASQGGVYTLKALVKYHRGEFYSDGVDLYPYRYEVLPLIKKAEIYLIAAEASDNDTDKARWLELLRLERGYLQHNTDAYAGALDQLIQDEYDREFYAEGQYFYYLKRNEINSVPNQVGGSTTLNSNNFVLPVPDAESFNRQ